jgi:hypothetical protein
MKTIALTLLVTALGSAQSQYSKSVAAKEAELAAKAAAKARNQKPQPSQTKAPPPAHTKAKSQAQSIPAGATLVEPNLYRYTDSSGKTWMYRQTPFGVSRWEENSTPAPQPVAKRDSVVVSDLGDSVRFEKKTPFGKTTWVRKKTELNDEEKTLLSGENPASTAASPSTKAANSQVTGQSTKEK